MVKITRIKLGVQILSTAVIAYLGFWVTQMISWKNIALTIPTFSCYYLDHRVASCFLRSLQETLSAGWSVKYTNVIAPIVLLLIFGLIFGRSWCAWVCPVGLVQDIFTSVRKLFKAGYYNLPEKFKTAAAIAKWSLLFALVFISVGITIPNFFLSAFQLDLFTPFCQICPSREIAPLFTGNFEKMWAYDTMSTLTKVMSYLAMGTFVFYLLTTPFIRRMWCRLCPMGAILGLLNRFSLLSLRKEGARCTKCGVCLRCCPVQVKEVYEEKVKERITPVDCTLCLRCVEMCPEDKALKVNFLKKSIVTSTFQRFIQSDDIRSISKRRRNLRERQ